MSVMKSASIARLCLMDIHKGITDVKQICLIQIKCHQKYWIKQRVDCKIEKVFKVEIHVTGQENELDKDPLLDIQKKLAEVLRIKGEMQMIKDKPRE